ncbi:hypothetical protein Hanom_Chr15g01367431 [Helianthus anomalus]
MAEMRWRIVVGWESGRDLVVWKMEVMVSVEGEVEMKKIKVKGLSPERGLWDPYATSYSFTKHIQLLFACDSSNFVYFYVLQRGPGVVKSF